MVLEGSKLMKCLQKFWWHSALIGFLFSSKDADEFERYMKRLPPNMQLLMPDLKLCKQAKGELLRTPALLMEMLHWLFNQNNSRYEMMGYYQESIIERRAEVPEWLQHAIMNPGSARRLIEIHADGRCNHHFGVEFNGRKHTTSIFFSIAKKAVGLIFHVDWVRLDEPTARFYRRSMNEVDLYDDSDQSLGLAVVIDLGDRVEEILRDLQTHPHYNDTLIARLPTPPQTLLIIKELMNKRGIAIGAFTSNFDDVKRPDDGDPLPWEA